MDLLLFIVILVLLFGGGGYLAPPVVTQVPTIKSTIQGPRRGRQRQGNFARACHSGLRSA